MPKKRTTQPADKPFTIVGVGASAGGLEALTGLLKALPVDTGMAFVVVQHMDPTHESMLTKLLDRATRMPVAQVTDGMRVEPNRVYVIPPNTAMTIRQRVLRLETRPVGAGRRTPIDRFFQSLADDRGANAIGIVLSGIGSDGTVGLKAIKAAGGITLAQNEESAQYPGMPLSAAAAGVVDVVSSVKGIADELSRVAGMPHAGAKGKTVLPDLAPSETMALRRILEMLRKHSGVDFGKYKPGTINRRIQRRLVLRKCENLRQYSQYLEAHPPEVEALFRDIVIHVTEFFRERDAFEALHKVIFPKITANHRLGDPIRIWVPGCSSGEEVYSIAIALLEYLDDKAGQSRIQIFGTDISVLDIEKARAGIYPESVTGNVSAERLRRFFSKVEGGYQINKTIREMCVLARHDLTRDPPFSRLDLISCRNVLIYLGPTLHKRVAAAFHYALKPTGLLLLGKAESLSGHANLFAAEGTKFRGYSRKATTIQPLLDVGLGEYERTTRRRRNAEEPGSPSFDLRTEGERVVLDRYAPPGFFVDADLHILHIQGDTSPYVKPTPGEPSFHLLKMVRPELVVELRTAVHQAKKEKVTVRRADVRLERNGESTNVTIDVIPLPEADKKAPNLLVLFERPGAGAAAISTLHPGAGKASSRAGKETDRLKRELGSTQEYLRSLIEDQETSAEELRAANEEILSSNEELQSTNEELETAKEELQSSNEELTTLNEELQNRNAELAQVANEVSNLLTGVDIPILILDSDHCIRRFTPSAEKVFNLIPTDVGRPISNLKPNIEIPDLEELVSQVSDEMQHIEQEVRGKDGRWYSFRVRAYRTPEGKTAGVLMALTDIDVLKRNLEMTTESRNIAEAEREQALQSLQASESALRRSQEQLRLLAGKLLASDEERSRRLSQQLLGDFNQRLTVLGLDLAKLESEIGSAPDRRRLRRLQHQVSGLTNDIARTAQRLHPPAVELLGLVSALREECREFSHQEGIPVKLNHRNVPDSLPQEVVLCLFRAVQESLSNGARHSKASKISVSLSGHPDGIRLSIKDNGCGFDPAKTGDGLGLVTTQERARTVGGTFAVDSAPGKGTEVVVEVPLPGPSGAEHARS